MCSALELVPLFVALMMPRLYINNVKQYKPFAVGGDVKPLVYKPGGCEFSIPN
jgi:hypothetical protein